MRQVKKRQRTLIPRVLYGVGFAVLMGILVLARQLQQMPLADSLTSEVDGALSQNTPQEAEQFDGQIFIPLVQGAEPDGTGPGLQQTPPHAEAIADVADEWEPYVFEDGGFSIRIPAGWRVQPFAVWGFELKPPEGDPQHKLAAHYLRYEKPELEELVSWLPKYYSREFGGEPELVDNIVTSIDLDTKSTRAETEQFIARSSNPDLKDHTYYYFVHGQLVLALTPVGLEEGQADLLRTIAESLEFLPDAPLDLVELDHPNPPPAWRTLEEFEQWRQDDRDASQAYAIRLETGQTPTEFLATLTDQARAIYADKLERNAHEVELWDQQREEEASMPPPSDPSETDYSGYWEGERTYCRWLTAQGELDGEDMEEMREYCAWLEEQEDLSNLKGPYSSLAPQPPGSSNEVTSTWKLSRA